LPWVFVRSKLAAHWGCVPWLVDTAPPWEIAAQLRLWALEAQAAPAAG
jgi:hypothetical protein